MQGFEEAVDKGTSEFTAGWELAGSGVVGPEQATKKFEMDAELALQS